MISIGDNRRYLTWNMQESCLVEKLTSGGCFRQFADTLLGPLQYENVTPSQINTIRARLSARVKCFCKPPPNQNTLWINLADVMANTYTFDPETGDISTTMLIGNGAGLWTNIPARRNGGVAVYGATLASNTNIVAEHWNELMRVCEALFKCAVTYNRILVKYVSCIDSEVVIFTMLPHAYATLKGIGGSCEGITGIPITVDPATGTAADLTAALLAAPQGIKWGTECFYQKGGTTCDLAWTCDGIYLGSLILVDINDAVAVSDYATYIATNAVCAQKMDVVYETYTSYATFNQITDCKNCLPACRRKDYLKCDGGDPDVQSNHIYLRGGVAPQTIIAKDQTGKLACWNFKEDVPCDQGERFKGKFESVAGCSDTRCLCCTGFDLDLLQLLIDNYRDRVRLTNAGTEPVKNPWTNTAYILFKDPYEDKGSCVLNQAYWKEFLDEINARMNVVTNSTYYMVGDDAGLYPSGVWINTNTWPNADISAGVTVTYFGAADYPTTLNPANYSDNCAYLTAYLDQLVTAMGKLIAVFAPWTSKEACYARGAESNDVVGAGTSYATLMACAVSKEASDAYGGYRVYNEVCVYKGPTDGPCSTGYFLGFEASTQSGIVAFISRFNTPYIYNLTSYDPTATGELFIKWQGGGWIYSPLSILPSNPVVHTWVKIEDAGSPVVGTSWHQGKIASITNAVFNSTNFDTGGHWACVFENGGIVVRGNFTL